MDLTRILEDNYEKFLRLAKRKISTSAISNISWLRINGAEEIEEIYIFKGNGSLMVSRNGSVQKCHYEYIVDSDSLIIEYEDDKAILFQSALIDKRFLILRKSSSNEFLAFANSTIFKDQLKRQIQRQFKNEMALVPKKPGAKNDGETKEIEEFPYEISKLFSYQGKLNRLHYFYSLVIVFILMSILSGIIFALDNEIIMVFGPILSLFMLYLIMVQNAKRLRDLNHSGWWAYPCLATGVGMIYLLLKK